jgi:hypothetical protein
MAKFELGKSVEGIKVNKRSGIPTTERMTIPFGAIIEDPREERDKIRFSYLGEIYDVPQSEVRGETKPIAGAAVAAPASPKAAAAAAPAPVQDPRFLKWESIPSSIPVSRAKVPGGWLVAVNQGVAFVADAAHAWDGDEPKPVVAETATVSQDPEASSPEPLEAPVSQDPVSEPPPAVENEAL